MKTMYLTNLKVSATALFASVALVLGAEAHAPQPTDPCEMCPEEAAQTLESAAASAVITVECEVAPVVVNG